MSGAGAAWGLPLRRLARKGAAPWLVRCAAGISMPSPHLSALPFLSPGRAGSGPAVWRIRGRSFHRRFGLSRQDTVCCKPQSQMESHTLSIKLPVSYSPDVVVGNPVELERKKKAIKAAGLSTLQVIADFDMTLTKYRVDGRRGQSCHALLCQGNVEYDVKRQQLYDHYYPLEICPTIPTDQKTKLMEEWWEKSHGLLVEGGLNFSNIKLSVGNAHIGFREGLSELFEILDTQGVPCLIFSAGLADIIEEVMRQKLHRIFSNIRVVSNRMNFDELGNLTGFRGRTIHVLNKNEHALEMAAPLHDDQGHPMGPENENGANVVKGRTNVLLLGDHLGDLGMSDGVNYENRISVGFLNENVESWLEAYKTAYDIVVLVCMCTCLVSVLSRDETNELCYVAVYLNYMLTGALSRPFVGQNDGSMDCVVNLLEELMTLIPGTA